MKVKLWSVLLLVSILFYAPVVALAGKPAFGGIPPFKILQTNGTFFSATDLPMDKPVVLIYFSPDCEHCQVLMNELFKKISAFKKVTLVLVTFKPVTELAEFEKKYNTAKYRNIVSGTEGNTFFLRMYYKIATTPFTALYDKNGKLLNAYRSKTDVEDLVKRVAAIR